MGPEAGSDLAGLAVAAEAAALARDAAGAVGLYTTLRPHEGERVPGAREGLAGGSVSYYLGLLARTAGNLEEAIRHLHAALAAHSVRGDEGWAARVRCELARVLLSRGDPPSRREALRHLDAVQQWDPADGTPPGDEAAGMRARAERDETPPANLIRREGDVWTLGFDGRICHVRDSKGLRWLAVLLRHPWREVPALSLEAMGDDDDHEKDTTSADPAAHERARVRVTRALRAGCERIAARHPALGRHLAATVHTGRSCVYVPDPRLPVEWES